MPLSTLSMTWMAANCAVAAFSCHRRQVSETPSHTPTVPTGRGVWDLSKVGFLEEVHYPRRGGRGWVVESPSSLSMEGRGRPQGSPPFPLPPPPLRGRGRFPSLFAKTLYVKGVWDGARSTASLYEQRNEGIVTMVKQIAFHDQAHHSMKRGVDVVAGAVKSTLGPRGRNVAIDQRFAPPVVTHDGVSIAKEIDLDDPLENMAAFLIREAASKTNDVAGDGTTTAAVLAQAIITEGPKNLAP